jgi:hypothetical protein
LLDTGEDPNRYDPVGGHPPLADRFTRQRSLAIWNSACLLIARGARIDIQDVLCKERLPDGPIMREKTEVEAYLRGFKESAQRHR